MEKIIEELNSLQKQIQDSKTKVSQLEGKREAQLAQLQEFGVKTIEEGNKKLEKMGKELGKLETDIQTRFKSLKESYEW
jgi:chromosome segregation ATPase